jgi:DNA polymerase
MSDAGPNWAARQLAQRLDALRRAGLDRIPRVGQSTMTRQRNTRTEATPPPAPPVLVTAPMLFEEPVRDEPALPVAERAAQLAVLNEQVSGCPRCEVLASTRTRTVFGEGSPTARLMFIGEAPGADEDRTGRPFVGRAGQLLTDMITKGMGLRREDVYIANILKCRPPENRVPLADEVANCLGYLQRQLEIIRPDVLCLLGKTAAASLLQTTEPMSRLRGRWITYRGIKTLITYHPAYLLRNPSSKRDAWEDLKLIMTELGLPVPSRTG